MGAADFGRFLSRHALAVTVTSSVSTTRDALNRDSFALVLLDSLAPGGSTEVELVARTGPGAPRPVLLVTDPGPLPAAAMTRALASVPFDLVRRDAAPEEVLLRVERLLEHAALRSELLRVRYEAQHDDRTGLLRNGPFQKRLLEHFSAAQRHGLALALVLIDLDRFGRINKDYDHTLGDDLIARAGVVIQRCLRTEDVGARIGGDEFAIVLPYTQPIDAAHVVQRLLGELYGLTGPVPRSFGRPGTLVVSGSIGFETFDGRDIDSPEALRRRAETALREAKRRGGNTAVYYRSLAGGATAQGPLGALPLELGLAPELRRPEGDDDDDDEDDPASGDGDAAPRSSGPAPLSPRGPSAPPHEERA